MQLRVGNLVRHKSGGPIMMVSRVLPRLPMMAFFKYECTWVEDNKKLVEEFDEKLLQTVYADGSPRNYDDE